MFLLSGRPRQAAHGKTMYNVIHFGPHGKNMYYVTYLAFEVGGWMLEAGGGDWWLEAGGEG